MNLDGVPAGAQESVSVLSDALKERLGDNAASLTLVGSVLSEDYSPRHSDINSVLVVKENRAEVLDFLAEIGPKMGRRKLAAPLLMRPEYIARSCDVFAVEWLDYQWRHLTVFGADPFAGLTFAKRDVRLQCEREYKSALVRLRQGYIGSAGKRTVIAHFLAAAGRELLPYLRATLWLMGIERPATAARTFEQAGQTFNVSLAALGERYARRYEKVRPDAAAAQSAFWQTCGAVEQLAERVDTMEA